MSATSRQLLCAETSVAPAKESFVREVDRIAQEISSHAIRRGSSAAWIGLDWLGDSEVSQLVPLGLDLYNGVAGIAVFLAAHAACARCESSAELALAAVSHLRKTIRGRNAARVARSLGLGGATGLGSIVYALTLMWKCLDDDDLLADALIAAGLFTDDLIAADKQFDVMAGGAGAILALLRLYRDTQSGEALRRATECGEHLLRQPRLGPEGRRSWVGQGLAGERSTACRTGPQASPMRSLHWRRRRDARTSPVRRRNASRSRIQTTTRNRITGRVCTPRRSRHGHANGVTALPASASPA